MNAYGLPAGISVFERGWLSSNNILLVGPDQSAIVDTGYVTHAHQTVSLVKAALGGRSLDVIANTHLHSDHCGGNAALQSEFPLSRTFIPPGQAQAVTDWNEEALGFATTGQSSERFRFDSLLLPGSEIRLGDVPWEIHGAPGHDPHSVILFEPAGRIAISADALWENGFGVVFPELDGVAAFDEVAATLGLIERLHPRLVIPGHGRVFGFEPGSVESAITRARSRLDGFVRAPVKHAKHSAKVFLKFKLLELQQARLTDFEDWAKRTAYFSNIWQRYFAEEDLDDWLRELIRELVTSGAAACFGDEILNA